MCVKTEFCFPNESMGLTFLVTRTSKVFSGNVFYSIFRLLGERSDYSSKLFVISILGTCFLYYYYYY